MRGRDKQRQREREADRQAEGERWRKTEKLRQADEVNCSRNFYFSQLTERNQAVATQNYNKKFKVKKKIYKKG